MRTNANFKSNLSNHVITSEMLGAALYSVNKRAKNYRDKAHEYFTYAYKEKARTQKELFYRKKDLLLSIAKPSCIHVEECTERERIYDDDSRYEKCLNGDYDIVHSNSYYDRETQEVVEFIDIIYPAKNIYLFYSIGGYSFHHPIHFGASDDTLKKTLKEYEGLEVKPIDTLITFGNDVNDLMSCQFVDKIIDLVKSGDYTLVD